MSDSKVTVTLKHPIHFGSQVISELSFRPLKAKDLRRLQSTEDRKVAMVLELACYLSGQTQEIIDELEGEDVLKVLEVVGDFFGGSPLTGGES